MEELCVDTTHARDRIGRYAFIAYIALPLVAYIEDRFGGPPTSVAADIAGLILVFWAGWFDHHRALRAGIGATVLA